MAAQTLSEGELQTFLYTHAGEEGLSGDKIKGLVTSGELTFEQAGQLAEYAADHPAMGKKFDRGRQSKKTPKNAPKEGLYGGNKGKVKVITNRIRKKKIEDAGAELQSANSHLITKMRKATASGKWAKADEIHNELLGNARKIAKHDSFNFNGYDGAEGNQKRVTIHLEGLVRDLAVNAGYKSKRYGHVPRERSRAEEVGPEVVAPSGKSNSPATPVIKETFTSKWLGSARRQRKKAAAESKAKAESQSEGKAIDWGGISENAKKDAVAANLLYDNRRSAQENLDLLVERTKKQKVLDRTKRLDKISGTDPVTGGALARLRRRQGPIGQFMSILSMLNRNARVITVVALLVGIVFVPVGIFQYAGWSIAALVMVIIGAVYAVILNVFKIVASIILGLINGLWTVLAGLGVRIVESVLAIFRIPKTDCQIGSATVKTNFCDGHRITNEGLIPFGELKAMEISLLDADALRPTPSAEPILFLLLRKTGLADWDLSAIFGSSIAIRMQDFMQAGNIWMVLFVFLVPTVVLLALVYFKWIKPALAANGV